MYRVCFFIILCFTANASWAVSVSTYRIYLDREHNVTDYWVSNKTLLKQECTIKFTHYQFDAAGNLTKYDTPNFIPNNSAKKIVRFSPKKFVITPKNKHKIRFTLRNKRDIEDIEYRSHIIVSCKDIKDDNDQIETIAGFAAVTVKPILTHHIPLVVRPRKLTAKLTIEDIVLADNKLIFDLVRSGKRSLYGQVNVKDQDNNIITSSRKFPLYHEVLSKNVSISLPEFEAKSLIVEFVETNELSDKLTASSTLVIK